MPLLIEDSYIVTGTVEGEEVAVVIDAPDVENFSFENDGGRILASGEDAIGIDVVAATGMIINQGRIAATGSSSAEGVHLAASSARLVNYGSIVAEGPDGASYGIVISGGGDAGSSHRYISNYGTITADIAIDARSDATSSTQTLYNSFDDGLGTIRGDIFLGGGDDSLRNYGSIQGDVHMGSGDDLVDSEFAIVGAIYLEDGDDVAQIGGTAAIYCGSGDDTAYSNGGVIHGEDGNDKIAGATGMYGGAGNDTLTGDGGAQILDGGEGADTMTGGAGNDIYYVDDVGDVVVERYSTSGNDTVYASISYTLAADVENLILVGDAALNGTGSYRDNKLTGNSGDNILSGGGGNDSLRGGEGADTLDGGDGNDLLRGQLGADVMYGGLGDDRYFVETAGDQVVERGSSGRDWVYSSISWTLGANLEALTLTGDDWIDATGNAKANAIYGNAGRNVITGGLGSDVMTGKASSDTFVFTSILDSTLEDADRITDLNDISDKIDMRRVDGDVNTAGVQGFTVVDAFSGHAGELVLSYDASTDITSLTVDVNGDGVADMLVRLNGEHESFDRFLFGGG